MCEMNEKTSIEDTQCRPGSPTYLAIARSNGIVLIIWKFQVKSHN